VDAVSAPTPLTKMKQGMKQDLARLNAAAKSRIRAYNGQVEHKAFLPTKREAAVSALREGGKVDVPTNRAEARRAVAALRDWSRTPLKDLILGRVGGCVGEVSAVALLVGGLVLVVLGHVRWQIPAFYLGTVALLAWLLPDGVQGARLVQSHETGVYLAQETTYYVMGDPLFHLFAGGLFLGAFFMATDMVTSPVTGKGQAIFAVGCGALTMVIRRFGGYPEGVCYAILLMNTASPLIDRYTKRKVFGRRPKSNA
jgi:electron transport complex protein RnfD